jgi:hypothetical protein
MMHGRKNIKLQNAIYVYCSSKSVCVESRTTHLQLLNMDRGKEEKYTIVHGIMNMEQWYKYLAILWNETHKKYVEK